MRGIAALAILILASQSSFAQYNRIQQARQTVQQANSRGAQQPQVVRQPVRPQATATSGTRQLGFIPPTGLEVGVNAQFGGGRYGGATGTAATASASSLSQAINMFYMDTGRLPRTTEGLNALLRPPAGVKGWKGPYVTQASWRQAFIDPWGNQYRYIDTTRPGGMPTFSIRSDGPDGTPNTRDDIGMDG